MNVVFDRSPDKKIAETEVRIEELRRTIRVKESEVARDMELAAACDQPGRADAVKIFESEKVRLALLHVKTLDKDDQAQIRGQCLQMELLSTLSDELETRLADGLRELEDAKNLLAEEGNKLQALRSKK